MVLVLYRYIWINKIILLLIYFLLVLLVVKCWPHIIWTYNPSIHTYSMVVCLHAGHVWVPWIFTRTCFFPRRDRSIACGFKAFKIKPSLKLTDSSFPQVVVPLTARATATNAAFPAFCLHQLGTYNHCTLLLQTEESQNPVYVTSHYHTAPHLILNTYPLQITIHLTSHQEINKHIKWRDMSISINVIPTRHVISRNDNMTLATIAWS